MDILLSKQRFIGALGALHQAAMAAEHAAAEYSQRHWDQEAERGAGLPRSNWGRWLKMLLSAPRPQIRLPSFAACAPQRTHAIQCGNDILRQCHIGEMTLPSASAAADDKPVRLTFGGRQRDRTAQSGRGDFLTSIGVLNHGQQLLLIHPHRLGRSQLVQQDQSDRVAAPFLSSPTAVS